MSATHDDHAQLPLSTHEGESENNPGNEIHDIPAAKARVPPTVSDGVALAMSMVARLPRPTPEPSGSNFGYGYGYGHGSTRTRTRTTSGNMPSSSQLSGTSRNVATVGELIAQLQRLWQRQRFRPDERAFVRDVDKIVAYYRQRYALPQGVYLLRATASSEDMGRGDESSSDESSALSTALVVPIDGPRLRVHQHQDHDSAIDSGSDRSDSADVVAVAPVPQSAADANVETLLDAMEPLFHHRYQEVRSLAFEVISLCLTHYADRLTAVTRQRIYEQLVHHDHGGDFEQRQRTMRILTHDGRRVDPFQGDLGGLLVDWLDDSDQQRDLLNLIQHILRRSPLSLDFEAVIAITSVVCGRCDVAWSRGDVETCRRFLSFFHVLATHRLEHALGTSVCLRTLCWMVNVDGQGTWSVMKHLLNSSAGFRVLRGLVVLLENPLQYNQWILRGAVFFVGMSCWGSQRVARLDEIKWAPILLALETCLQCDNGVVVFEIILAIQRLIKKYGDGKSLPSSTSQDSKPCRRLIVEWDIILRMLRTLQPWLCKTDGTAENRNDDQSDPVRRCSRSSEAKAPSKPSTSSSHSSSQHRTEIPVHMTRIPKELLDTLQVVVDLVRDGKFAGEVEEFYDVLQEYFEYLPEPAVQLLLRYRAETAHPAHHINWLHTLEDTMETFFMNRNVPAKIREESLELLQVNLWSSRNVCEDRVIEEVLLPMLAEVYDDPEPSIRRRGLDLITEVARTLESVRFESLLDILENAVQVSAHEDAQLCAMSGIVSLFSSYFNHLPQSRALRMYDIITSAVESHRNWLVRRCALECVLHVCEASSESRLQWRDSHVRTSRFLFCSRRAVRNQPTVPVSHGLRALLTRISTEAHAELFRMSVEGLRRMLSNRLILADIDISDMAMKIISCVDYHAFGRAAIPDEIALLIAEMEIHDADAPGDRADASQAPTERQERSATLTHQPHHAPVSTRVNFATAKTNVREASALLCKTRFTTMGLKILELFVSYMNELDLGTRHHLMVCFVGVLTNPMVVSEADILSVSLAGSDSTSSHSESGWIWSSRGRTASASRPRGASVATEDCSEQASAQASGHGAANYSETKPVSPHMAFTSRVLSRLQSSTHHSSLFNVLSTTQPASGGDKRSRAMDSASNAASASLKHDRAILLKCLRLMYVAEFELLHTAVNAISLLAHIMPDVIMASLAMLLQSAKTCFYTRGGELRGDAYAAVVEMVSNLVASTPKIALPFEHKSQIVRDIVLVAFQHHHTDKVTSYLAYRVLCEVVFRCDRREDRLALGAAALPLLREYSKSSVKSLAITEAAIDFLTCFALSRSDSISAPALRITSHPEDNKDPPRTSRSWAHHNAIVSIESCAGKPAVLIVRRANLTSKWHLAMCHDYIIQESIVSELEEGSYPEDATPVVAVGLDKISVPSDIQPATSSAGSSRAPHESEARVGSAPPPRPPARSHNATRDLHLWKTRTATTEETDATSVTHTATSQSHIPFSVHAPHHLPVPPLPAYDGVGGSPSFFCEAAPVATDGDASSMERMLLTDPVQVIIEPLHDLAESAENTEEEEDHANASNSDADHETNGPQQSDLSVSPLVTEESDGIAEVSMGLPDEDCVPISDRDKLPHTLESRSATDVLNPTEQTDSLFLMMQLFDIDMDDRPRLLADGASLALGLSVLDRTPEFETHKVGVLYLRSSKQKTETEILGNFGGSLRYLKFLRTLGTVTRLEGLHGFSGGLDTSDSHSDGKYTLLYRSHSLQMVFHVATMMTPHEELEKDHDLEVAGPSPQSGNTKKTMNKKRHIGNDFVHIVFKECDDDYDVQTFSGHFNDVHIIVQPLNDHEYRTQVKCKPGITPFGPLYGTQVIPSAIVAQCVRQTCLNANLACQAFHQEAIGFTMNCEERLKQIKQLGARHATLSDEWTLLHPATSEKQ